MPQKLINLTGKQYGRLTVIELCKERGPSKHALWRCVCSCGQEKNISGSDLRNGSTISCGCYSREAKAARNVAAAKHGHKRKVGRTPEYGSWTAMRDRVLNPNNSNHSRWGGRGIRICERWDDFVNFYADMGPRPAGHSLDRIDNNGNYEPGNCRWATASEQMSNRRPYKKRKKDVHGEPDQEGAG